MKRNIIILTLVALFFTGCRKEADYFPYIGRSHASGMAEGALPTIRIRRLKATRFRDLLLALCHRRDYVTPFSN